MGSTREIKRKYSYGSTFFKLIGFGSILNGYSVHALIMWLTPQSSRKQRTRRRTATTWERRPASATSWESSSPKMVSASYGHILSTISHEGKVCFLHVTHKGEICKAHMYIIHQIISNNMNHFNIKSMSGPSVFFRWLWGCHFRAQTRVGALRGAQWCHWTGCG